MGGLQDKSSMDVNVGPRILALGSDPIVGLAKGCPRPARDRRQGSDDGEAPGIEMSYGTAS